MFLLLMEKLGGCLVVEYYKELFCNSLVLLICSGGCLGRIECCFLLSYENVLLFHVYSLVVSLLL